MVILLPLLIIIGASLPSLAWLLFFLKEDVHPEPKRLIIYTFSIGALITIPVLVAQVFFQSIFFAALTKTLVLIVILALIEEVFKFLAAYWAIHKDPAFDEPVDAMIYMIAAALGFATIENLFIISNVFDSMTSASLSAATSVLLLRFVGATLLHVLASALLGFYWAKGRIEKKVAPFIVKGIVVATLVHGAFNYLILKFQNNNLLYAGIFLVVAAFFVFQDFEKLKMSYVREKGML